MFEDLKTAPPDSIFGIAEAFRNDPSTSKISLAVGVYCDEAGKTPVFRAVKIAEERLLERERSKSYLPIQGLATYSDHVRDLLFGAHHPAVVEGRIATVQTPGGTGGLRVVADFLARNRPGLTVHLTNPTWANHQPIFASAGLACETLPYFDPRTNDLDFEGFCESLQQASRGDAVVLHGCCHNPTGVDPSLAQWSRIAEILSERGLLPLVDFAYQGFAVGLEEDAGGLRMLCDMVPELIVCSSFSKNFGLYNDRVGAASIVTGSADVAAAAMSQLKRTIRTNYSNPPAHGASVVSIVLNDSELRSMWEAELDSMRDRVHEMRSLLASSLDEREVKMSADGNDFMVRQKGMFSFSGLTPNQVSLLRDQFSIYIVGSGRINVAGLTHENLPVLCDAIARVTTSSRPGDQPMVSPA